MRRRIYEALTNPRPNDVAGRVVSFVLLLLIAANVVANVLETDVDLARRAESFFLWFEVVSVAVFTLEIILRLWTCTADQRFSGGLKGRLRLLVRPMSLVDIAAIAPFYFELFLRALRLMRLLRLFRFGRLANAFTMLTRVILAKRAELGVTLAVVGLAVLLAAGAIYTAEHGEPNTSFTSIPRAMWWSVVTITTVGYGDMTPTTPIGQVIGGLVAFSGICALALPVGILSTGFFYELNRTRSVPPTMTTRKCLHCGGMINEEIADSA
jgi:voltage-gated potassium channel